MVRPSLLRTGTKRNGTPQETTSIGSPVSKMARTFGKKLARHSADLGSACCFDLFGLFQGFE